VCLPNLKHIWLSSELKIKSNSLPQPPGSYPSIPSLSVGTVPALRQVTCLSTQLPPAPCFAGCHPLPQTQPQHCLPWSPYLKDPPTSYTIIFYKTSLVRFLSHSTCHFRGNTDERLNSCALESYFTSAHSALPLH
jgi:hypothetical protein